MRLKEKRSLIAILGALAIPLISLAFGVYGSLLWTFPLVVIWCGCVRPAAFQALGFSRKSLGLSLAIGAVSGVILGIGCGEIIRALGIGELPKDAIESGFTGVTLAKAKGWLAFLAYYAYYIIAVGIGEELFWRGLVQQELKRKLSRTAAIVTTALVFGAIHAFLWVVVPFWPGLAFLALIALGGSLWGYFFERSGNIWGIALSHGICSATIWKFYFFAY